MARPSRKRTALLLYGILLVLPTVVLGGLHWHQLWLDHQLALANLPLEAAAATERFAERIRAPLEELLEAEAQRRFDEYAPLLIDHELAQNVPEFALSPLASAPARPGILGWFAADMRPYVNWSSGPPASPIHVQYGRGPTPGEPLIAERIADANAVLLHNVEIGFLARTARLSKHTLAQVPWQVIAGHLVQFHAGVGGAQAPSPCFAEWAGTLVDRSEPIVTTDFFLEIVSGPDGRPVASATRRVLPEDVPRGKPELGDCGERLHRDFYVVQGFLLDIDWLFGSLPQELASTLTPRERYLAPGAPLADVDADLVHRIDLAERLGFAAPAELLRERRVLGLVLEQGTIDRSFRAQLLRFLGVAAMLVLSLGTGLGLLLFNVNRELERAERTRNFVAAVTHELRTPLSTIALHVEMLVEGWAQSPERRQEYYLRIARETQRLTTLVERVLEKSRLSRTLADNRPEGGDEVGDLSQAVRTVGPLLAAADPRGVLDVEYELGADLGLVRLNQEAITSIVVNLVENARKYAPVGPGGEPILVRTLSAGPHVFIEVLDRGPGVPEAERERIFEAFYRMGNEATRTSTGTGLGLHLVDLQSRALGGRAWVEARSGGGSIFKVRLPKRA